MSNGEAPRPDLSQLPPPPTPSAVSTADLSELPPPSSDASAPAVSKRPRRLGIIIAIATAAVVIIVAVLASLPFAPTQTVVPSSDERSKAAPAPPSTGDASHVIPESSEDSATDRQDASDGSFSAEVAASGRWSSFRGLYPLFDSADVDFPAINVISSGVPSPGSSVTVEAFIPLEGCYASKSSEDEVGPSLNVIYCPADVPLPESIFSDLNPVDGTASGIRNDDELQLAEERLLFRVGDMAVLMERS